MISALDLRAFLPVTRWGRVEGQWVLLETAGPPVLGKEVSAEARADL